MLNRPIAFDLSRLVTRLAHRTPTGIDRVDLAYARWLFEAQDLRFAIVSTPFGPRILRRSGAAALMSLLDERWSDTHVPEADPVYRDVATRLGVPIGHARTGPTPSDGHDRRDWRIRLSALIGSSGAGALPQGTIYVHTSHLRLERPERFAWLRARPDIGAVFFVHDLIPIDHPEFGRPGEDRRHRTRMETIARHGRQVIVNSADVKRSLETFWADRQRPVPPVTVAPLGIEKSFTGSRRGDPSSPPFFLVCGTIEPRKNHALLLQVWRRLADRGGTVPKLVIAGRRGWESENVIDILERASFVRNHVIEAPGLSTPALARLMSQARAVLMPSFAEGYGLPVAEALSIGTPVIASDIPVHREVAGSHATLIDPLDGPAWLAAIEARAAAVPSTGPAAENTYRPPRWDDHFTIAGRVLAAVA